MKSYEESAARGEMSANSGDALFEINFKNIFL